MCSKMAALTAQGLIVCGPKLCGPKVNCQLFFRLYQAFFEHLDPKLASNPHFYL
jgi:hypothetical protein